MSYSTTALNNTLTFDLLQQTHMGEAFRDYDDIASFDILILALMIPLATRVGGFLAHTVY